MIDFQLASEEVRVNAKDDLNEEAVLTATLIQETFELKNTGMRVKASEMRYQELNKEMNKLYDNLEEWGIKPDSRIVLRKLQALLSRESAFAAFKRAYIRRNIDRYPELERYIV